ncbi:uncharacterized protein ACRADG_012980 [Cochliomyia hominivorax]
MRSIFVYITVVVGLLTLAWSAAVGQTEQVAAVERSTESVPQARHFGGGYYGRPYYGGFGGYPGYGGFGFGRPYYGGYGGFGYYG